MSNKNKPQIKLMQGNEAIARGALDAGIDFFAGYPITPSTEVAEVISEEIPKQGGKFIQMEDEIASISAIIGASLAGAKVMTATSGPGISLMLEGIGFAKMVETPVVVVNVMRGGPSTGLPTSPSQADIMQSRWGNHGDAPAIVLYPSSVLESYQLTIRAFNLAEKYRTCVMLLSDELLGHMREPVKLPDLEKVNIINRLKPTVPPEWYNHYENDPKYPSPLASFGEGYRFHVTGLAHDAKGFPTNRADEIQIMANRLDKKIKNNLKDIVHVESFKMDDPGNTAIFAAGVCARAAKAAIVKAHDKRRKVGLIRPITIWPFPDEVVRKQFENIRNIIVPELNQGQLIKEVERVMTGKKKKNIIPINKVNGELITPEEILSVIEEL